MDTEKKEKMATSFNMSTREAEATSEKAKEKAFEQFNLQNARFDFSKPAEETRKAAELSPELVEALMQSRSNEYMDAIRKQAVSALSEDQVRLLIAREVIKGGAESTEDIVKLSAFLDSTTPESTLEEIISDLETDVELTESPLLEEITEEDVADFYEMIAASIEEAIAEEELQLKEALKVIDKKLIDESYHLRLCPITPAHDIHVLPKDGHLFFCHLVRYELDEVFQAAKKLLMTHRAYAVHVVSGCAFAIDSKGEVIERIDTVEEALDLILKRGWEELP